MLFLQGSAVAGVVTLDKLVLKKPRRVWVTRANSNIQTVFQKRYSQRRTEVILEYTSFFLRSGYLCRLTFRYRVPRVNQVNTHKFADIHSEIHTHFFNVPLNL
jgi:hypothetical protein